MASNSLLVTIVVLLRLPAAIEETVKSTVTLAPMSRSPKLILIGLVIGSESVRIEPKATKIPGLAELNPLSTAWGMVLLGSPKTT